MRLSTSIDMENQGRQLACMCWNTQRLYGSCGLRVLPRETRNLRVTDSGSERTRPGASISLVMRTAGDSLQPVIRHSRRFDTTGDSSQPAIRNSRRFLQLPCSRRFTKNFEKMKGRRCSCTSLNLKREPL